MDILVRNYLMKEKRKHDMRQLRKAKRELDEANAKYGPKIEAARAEILANRSKGDGFIITDLKRC